MTDLFTVANSNRGRFLAEQGIKRISGKPENAEWIMRARSIALHIAAKCGEVTADAVRTVMKEEPPHPNCWGAVFRSKGLIWNGRMLESSKSSRKSGLQRIWDYAG